MNNYDPDASSLNQALIEYLFQQEDLISPNTAEQDTTLVIEFTAEAWAADIVGDAPPLMTEEIIRAAHRATIRAEALGDTLEIAFELATAIKERQQARLYRLLPDLGSDTSNLLNKLMGRNPQ